MIILFTRVLKIKMYRIRNIITSCMELPKVQRYYSNAICLSCMVLSTKACCKLGGSAKNPEAMHFIAISTIVATLK